MSEELEVDELLKLDNQVCFPLYAASRLVVQSYRPFLAEIGLTYPQYLVLMVLWENDGLGVHEIGKRLHLDSATLTPILKRMEKNGLLKRQRSTEDNRTVKNWVTETATDLKQKAAEVPVQLLCNANVELEDLQSLKEHLEGLLHKLVDMRPALI